MTPVRIARRLGLQDTEGVRMVLVDAVVANRPRRTKTVAGTTAAGPAAAAPIGPMRRPWRSRAPLLMLLLVAGLAWQSQEDLAGARPAWLPWWQVESGSAADAPTATPTSSLATTLSTTADQSPGGATGQAVPPAASAAQGSAADPGVPASAPAAASSAGGG